MNIRMDKMETSNKTIAVLIPCYNEAVTIEKVVTDFKKYLPSAAIYVYDNNSSDNTAEIAVKAGAIVRHEPKQGKGNVVNSMFRDIEADCYIMVDGDDTYEAFFAPSMCDKVLNDGYDMVIGDRLSTTYFEENKRRFHNFGNVLVRTLVNVLHHGQIHDVMTGYRAMSKSFVKSLPVLSEGFQIETEITVHALKNKMKIAEIPIEYRDRPADSHSKLNTVKDGMKILWTIIKTIGNRRK